MAKDNKRHLRKEPAKWKHLPTASRRYPVELHEQLDAIARWADNQENPEEALAAILEFINNK